MRKNVLITGLNGFVGNELQSLLEENGCNVFRISLKNNDWKLQSLSKFDVVIHLAALVHNNTPNAKMVDYMNINYHLTKQLAKKAKNDGVTQFIFLSTMSVYGLNGSLKEKVQIDQSTPYKPNTAYGSSKLLAERAIQLLIDRKYVVNIVRPPMIFGNNGPGNFAKLIKVAKLNAVFPKINNERSVIHIDNLCIHLLGLMNNPKSGITHPQNEEFMNTNSALKLIRKYSEKKIKVIEIPIPMCFKNILGKIKIFNKIYGNLTYSKSIDERYLNTSQYKSFEQSVQETIN
ncbi:NAD-dependent epimerase/dehydratase family protein [Staphylococcus sp. IPLA37011]|uniref:NAD-dependent epimerase/dehydratase family protein n=1 Tax=Staphylococcus TaxID=1279 RepID=UPI002552978E|nr:NAD-dependent epimerase/dehydratase family protein [Staphylococcus equorum]MDK9871678.1 NAD-dependent epimerase/dehydratase family protein [Staphylococcus equorum]